MNIYDEVKVITHQEARKIVKSNHNKFYTEGTFTNDIQNYIAQCEAKEQRAKKVEELLGLYRLEKELKEKYHTSGSLYIMQHVLDELRDIAEEINLKEEELEEMK